MKKIKLNVVDAQASADLWEVNQKILKLCKIPKKLFTEANHAELSDLLIKRAELASKASGLKISSVVKK